ncbi:hypothetical protein EDB84DRAFT_1446865 [Lactarius hengduanensis]|nr:hypothetical protein EDB84DRAFT_1446865 [Lactarius hengduanensis]
MFTSRGQSSLSTLAFLLHLYLPTIFLLLPVFLPLLSDADPPKHCQCVPSLVAVSSITLALASILVAGDGSGIVGEQDFPSSMFAPCSNRLRFLLPDLTLNRANGHGYLKATPTTIARQHRQLQVDTDSGDKDISDDSEAASMTTATGDAMERRRAWCSLAKTKWNASEDSKLGWVDMRTGWRSQAHGAGEQVPVTVGLGMGLVFGVQVRVRRV